MLVAAAFFGMVEEQSLAVKHTKTRNFFDMGIFKKRSIASLGKKKSDMPEGLWNKCPSCGAIIDEITLKQRHRVCTKCDHHFTLLRIGRND